MNKIDIHQIYKIEDENQNKDIKNKKRKFGDYFDINSKDDIDFENNEKIKKPLKKNIKLEINKINNFCDKNSILVEHDFNKEKSENNFDDKNIDKENNILDNINLFFKNIDANKNNKLNGFKSFKEFKLFDKPQCSKKDYFLSTLGIWKEKDELKQKNKEVQRKERNERYKNRNIILNKKELLNKINKKINLIKKNKN
jgi:hypothetical protein